MPEPGEWVHRPPIDPPTVDFICLDGVRVEGPVGGAAAGIDAMEIMVVDTGDGLSHCFKISPGVALTLANAIIAWVNEEQPEWQQDRPRHIHVQQTSGNIQAGGVVAFWVPPEEEDKSGGEWEGLIT